MANITESNYVTDAIKYELTEFPEFSREKETLAAGQNLSIGTVVAKSLTDDKIYSLSLNMSISTVTGEAINSGAMPVVNTKYYLANKKVSSLVITDSATTPATLVYGTHYISDNESGSVQFLNVTGFTAPIKASYIANKSIDEPYGILAEDVDATLIDKDCNVITRMAVVSGNKLIWPAGITDAHKKAAINKLNTKNIVVRQSA